MHRSLKFAASTGIALVALTACADASVVATVNDQTIAGESVTELRHSFQDSITVGGDAYRGDLTNVIVVEAEKDAAAEDFGLTDLDDPARIAATLADPKPADAAILESVKVDPDRTDAALELVAEQLIIRDDVTTALLAEESELLADLFENQPEALAQVCARHILTATEQETVAARDRIAAGEGFAAVADAVSLDEGSPGGELPCPTAASAFVAPFGTIMATAPLGEVSVPFETQFGWHIAVVDVRDAPEDIAALLADPLAFLDPATAGELWAAWRADAVVASEVEVRSQVGVWSPDAGGILPPPSG